jgi:hypothetical protein
MKIRTILLVLIMLSTGAGQFPAEARDDMSGRWAEDYSETIYSVDQWSPACGQTPTSTGRKKRNLIFDMQDRGIDLLFQNGKMSFSSSGCQSANKAVQPKERTVKDKFFMIACSTKDSSKEYESGIYSFRIKSPARIEYRETTRYSRNVAGSMCVHTMRIRRVYSKQAEKSPTIQPATGNTQKKEPETPPVEGPKESHDPCQHPGPPFSLALLGLKKGFLDPGGRLCLKPVVMDANGCKQKTTLSWVKKPADLRLHPDGCLVASKQAKPGPRALTFQAKGLQVDGRINIRRPKPAKPREERKEKPKVAAEEQPKPKLQEQPKLQKEADASSSGWVFPAAVGFGVFILVVLIFFLNTLRRKTKSPTDEKSQPEPRRPYVPSAPTRIEPLRVTVPEPEEGKCCHQCHAQMPAGSEFCTQCGAPVKKPVSETTGQPETEPGTEQVFCIHCGEKPPEGAKFCPFCQQKIS